MLSANRFVRRRSRSAVVVADQVHIEIAGHVLVDVPERGQEFLMAVTALALDQHLTAGNIERGE